MADEARPKLTKREREIMALIAQGLNSRQIAEQLSVSYFTVRKHRSNILPKLNLHDAAEFQAFAARHFLDIDLYGPKSSWISTH